MRARLGLICFFIPAVFSIPGVEQDLESNSHFFFHFRHKQNLSQLKTIFKVFISLVFILKICLEMNYPFQLDCITNYDHVDFGQILHGYDIFRANAFAENIDPGFMNGKIFLGECSGKNIEENRHHRDFVTVRSNLRCSGQFHTASYRTTREFSDATIGQFNVKNDVERELGKTVNGFTEGSQTKVASSREEVFTDIYQLLAQDRAEVVSTWAFCYTHDIAVTDFARHRFSPDFITALYTIHESLKTNVQDQITAYSEFTRNFGTHFIRRAKLGASLNYFKAFASRSFSNTRSLKRKQCLVGTAAECRNQGVDSGSFSGSQKTCVNSKLEACLEEEFNVTNAFESSTASVYIVTRGSKPIGDIGDWAKDENFVPIPISMDVEPIVNLITDVNVAENPKYGFPEGLNASAIKEFFNIYDQLYCENYLGLSSEVCQEELTGNHWHNNSNKRSA